MPNPTSLSEGLTHYTGAAVERLLVASGEHLWFIAENAEVMECAFVSLGASSRQLSEQALGGSVSACGLHGSRRLIGKASEEGCSRILHRSLHAQLCRFAGDKLQGPVELGPGELVEWQGRPQIASAIFDHQGADGDKRVVAQGTPSIDIAFVADGGTEEQPGLVPRPGRTLS